MAAAIEAKIKDYLDGQGAQYRILTHAPAASADEYHAVLGTRYEQQAKAILIRFKRTGEKGFVVIALQAQKKVDLERVRSLLGAKEVRLATREQLAESTGCEFGELPPFGQLFGLPLIFDVALRAEDEIFFNAGALTTSIAMDPEAIVKFEQPIAY